MRHWDAARVARAAGAQPVHEPGGRQSKRGPRATRIDSRDVTPGDLFIGLRGEQTDGGAFAASALEAGAWGVLVTPEHATQAGGPGLAALAAEAGNGVVLVHDDPLSALQALARAWRKELVEGGTKVVAITGSTGKTSTKDILGAILSGSVHDGPATGRRTAVSPENLNTEIGLPLAVLAAPSDTEVLVLEMAMRGAGQIAELTAIAEPDVGVIVNIGPVHLELLGSLEAIAAAKAELIAGLAPGATVVIPVAEPLLCSHLRADVRAVTFGDCGDYALEAWRPPSRELGAGEGARGQGADDEDAEGVAGEVVIREAERSQSSHALGGAQIILRPSFAQAYNVQNLLAAVAAARALGVTPEGRVDVRFSARRGERIVLAGGVVLIDDCYNANPVSMRAAIDDLAETAPARSVAVLGDMLELGPEAPRFHREIGAYASARGIELLVTVGSQAAAMRADYAGTSHSVPDAAAAVELLAKLLRDRDTVLVKGSRGVGLEQVVDALQRARKPAPEPGSDDPLLAPCAGPGRR